MSQMEFQPPETVMVTGGGGHLGGKVVEALGGAPWCKQIICTTFGDERPIFSERTREKLRLVQADLTKQDNAWLDAVADADAVIHIAASNPVPDSTWGQAIASFDMSQNIGLAALNSGVRRLAFFSSNHVMGGYKDDPLARQIGPGQLGTDLPPAPGTHWANGTKQMDSTAYAASKILGERFFTALAQKSGGRMSIVSIRIGWALPGDNLAASVSLSGSPADAGAGEPADEDGKRTLRWFRNMWLSNGDLERLALASLTADPQTWPAYSIVVNGVSNNADMDWSLSEAEGWLGYRARDDLYAQL